MNKKVCSPSLFCNLPGSLVTELTRGADPGPAQRTQIKDLQAAKAKAPYKTVQEVENQIKCVRRFLDDPSYSSPLS